MKYITNTVNVFYGYSIAEKEHSGKSNHYDRSLTDVRDLSYDSTFLVFLFRDRVSIKNVNV